MIRPYSSTEHLARSLWLGRFKWTNRMAMYSAYFDDSGHPDAGRYLVAAGAVADIKQWVHLEREWMDALRPLGISVFHATDLPHNIPDETQREHLMARLSSIIELRVEKTFSATIDLGQYLVVNKKYTFAEHVGFPYPYAVRVCMGQVSEWAKKHSIPRSEIKFFIESGTKHIGQIEWIAERDGFPVPVPLEKSEVPLQAADLLAWFHHLYQISNGKISDGHLSALDRLHKASSSWGIVDMEDPDRLPTVCGVPLRDPAKHYQFQVLRKDGRRTAVVKWWPRSIGEPQFKRFILPEPVLLSSEDIKRLTAEYDAKNTTRRKQAAERSVRVAFDSPAAGGTDAAP